MFALHCSQVNCHPDSARPASRSRLSFRTSVLCVVRNLSEPREASRSLRRNNRALGSPPYRSAPLPLPNPAFGSSTKSKPLLYKPHAQSPNRATIAVRTANNQLTGVHAHSPRQSVWSARASQFYSQPGCVPCIALPISARSVFTPPLLANSLHLCPTRSHPRQQDRRGD
jgi:hypothetical protein